MGSQRIVPGFVRERLARMRAVRWLRLWTRFRFRLRGRLVQQLSQRHTAQATPPQQGGPRILVPLIETSHYQHLQVLILAKSLALRGAQVKVVICGQTLDGCEIRSVRDVGVADPCLTCRFNERTILPLFGLEVVRLSDFIDGAERRKLRDEAARMVRLGREHMRSAGEDLFQTVEDSTTRFFYGAVPDDAAVVERVRIDHLATTLLSMEVAKQLAEQWNPDIVLTHMTSYSAWEPYFRFFRRRGTQINSLSLSQFDFSRVILNSFELFPAAERFARFVRNRAGRLLDGAEKRQLDEFIGKRKQGSATIFQHDNYFDPTGSDEVRTRIGFDPNKRNIFLFSNLYWDVGLSNQAGLFDDVLGWVLGTIEALRDHPECHLYIKPHPAEVFGSANSMKGVAQFVRERFPQLPANVTIIEPAWKLNTYQLFPLIDLGVIFTGTLGLEMMLADIPVVSTGATSHKGLGFAAEPDSLDDYSAILLGRAATPRFDRHQLELFAYFYFLRTLVPWKLTKRAYADNFDGFAFGSIEDIRPGSDPQLDHLCNCILDPAGAVVEAWPEAAAQDPSQPQTMQPAMALGPHQIQRKHP